MNTKEYKPKTSNTVTVQYVEGLAMDARKAVIIGSGSWQEYGEGEDKVRKPMLPVEINGESKEWTLNATTNERLGTELGTFETEQWIGAVVKLIIDKQGDTKYVTATVVQTP